MNPAKLASRLQILSATRPTRVTLGLHVAALVLLCIVLAMLALLLARGLHA